MATSENLKSILDVEISRLQEKASIGPLNDMDVKKLEALTRAWKTYNATQEVAKAPQELTLTDEELLALAKS